MPVIRARLGWLAAASILWLWTGCGDAASGGPDVSDISDSAGAADVTDTAQAGDTLQADIDAPDTAPGREPAFVLGTNLGFQAVPSAFVPLAEGDEMQVELGFQGLWMVVLAFKQRGLLEGPLALSVAIEIDGKPRGNLELVGQQMLPGPDSWRYLYNFFLVVDDPETAPGNDAVITVDAVDELGAQVHHSQTVKLIAEPQ